MFIAANFRLTTLYAEPVLSAGAVRAAAFANRGNFANRARKRRTIAVSEHA